jgi:hypothetical protein
MNLNHYTPIHYGKRSLHLSQLISTHFEPLLLSVLILTGIIGSVYLFGHNIVGANNTDSSVSFNSKQPTSLAGFFLNKEEDAASNDFDDYVKIDSKVQAGQKVYFDFLKDEKASRYVMEMGDGVRLIVTQKNLMYVYEEPGKYVIELKEIKDGLLHLIGTKKIKVK